MRRRAFSVSVVERSEEGMGRGTGGEDTGEEEKNPE
jgi:hypothetical protein